MPVITVKVFEANSRRTKRLRLSRILRKPLFPTLGKSPGPTPGSLSRRSKAAPGASAAKPGA
jgi:hypothetical protein